MICIAKPPLVARYRRRLFLQCYGTPVEPVTKPDGSSPKMSSCCSAHLSHSAAFELFSPNVRLVPRVCSVESHAHFVVTRSWSKCWWPSASSRAQETLLLSPGWFSWAWESPLTTTNGGWVPCTIAPLGVFARRYFSRPLPVFLRTFEGHSLSGRFFPPVSVRADSGEFRVCTTRTTVAPV